jgi:type I restriction enzyme, S subunit
MSWEMVRLAKIASMKTGKLDSNAAIPDGEYPFFTCSQQTLRINEPAFDTEAVLLGGNNAAGIFPLKYYKGQFNAYQRTYVIESINSDALNIRYLYYALRPALSYFQSASIGAATQYLTKGILDNFRVALPSISEQDRIASILSAYDDLIENNRRRIQLLEQAARLLYREWFVRLRFPGHEHVKIKDGVPEGWEKKTLGVIAETNVESYKASGLPDAINYIDISSVSLGRITAKNTMRSTDAPGRARRKAKSGDIIWSNVRPNLKAYALVLFPEDNDIFSTGFTIVSPVAVPFSYLYLFITTDEFIGYLVNHTTGASYPAVRADDFERADILIPSKKVLELFHEKTEPIYIQIHILEKEINALTKARDLLLPRLMNGVIPV